MKSVNIWFEDDDFETLTTAKGEQTWREFVLTLIRSKT
jgi:hypothetical protein